MPERRQEELELFRDYNRSGCRAARDALVERYLPLARSLARRYARGCEPLDDLEQVASLALVKAVDGFEVERGTAFSSYAVPSIIGALKRHYRDAGWAVRPPRAVQELALRVTQIADELAAGGESPTAAEIAEYAGVSVEQVLEAREAQRALYSDSLDQPRGADEGDEGDSLLDTIGRRDAEIARAFDRVALEALLTTLEPRERLIIRLYYQQELTQREIGRRLGYSQMHISRLLHKAIDQLVHAAVAQEPDRRRSAA